MKDQNITLLTNGTKIKSHTNILKLADKTIISLDVRDSSNRNGLDRDKLIQDIKDLPESLKSKLFARSVIARGEENLIKETKKFIEEIGIQYIVVPCLPNSHGDLVNVPNMYMLDDELMFGEQMSVSRCGAGTSIIAVNYDGVIYPCQNLLKNEFAICSIFDDNWIAKLKDSDVVTKIRMSNVNYNTKCKDCNVKYICGGGCRALSYNVYGCLNHRLDFFCDFFYKSAIERLKKISFVE